MKASQYKEAYKREKKAGRFQELSGAEKKQVLDEWNSYDVSYRSISRLFQRKKIQAISTAFTRAGIDTKKINPEKVAVRLFDLQRPLSFPEFVAILESSTGDSKSAYDVAEDVFFAVGYTPPITKETHEAIVRTQSEHLPERLKQNEAGFPAKEWIKTRLRPLMQSPAAIAIQEHLKEVQQLNDAAERQQNFLPDGRPAGIQHVLAERGAKIAKDVTIRSMAGDAPRDPKPSETPKSLLELKTKLLSLKSTSPGLAAYVPIVKFIADPSPLGQQEFSEMGLNLSKVTTPRGVEISSGTDKVIFTPEDIFKLLELGGANLEKMRSFLGLVDGNVALFCSGNSDALAAIQSKAQSYSRSQLVRDCITQLIKTSIDDSFVSEIKNRIETTITDRNREPQTKDSTSDAWARAAILKAFVDASGDTRFVGVKYPKALDESEITSEPAMRRPRVLNKILVEGKEYKDVAEKEYVLKLCDLPDGDNRVWGKLTLTVRTDATSGQKTFSYEDKKKRLQTFVLSIDEQEKLRRVGTEKKTDIEIQKNAIKAFKGQLGYLRNNIDKDRLDEGARRQFSIMIAALLSSGSTYEITSKKILGTTPDGSLLKASLKKDTTATHVIVSADGVTGRDAKEEILISDIKMWKAKLEGTGSDLKIPAKLQSALTTLGKPETTSIHAGDERSILEQYMNVLARVKTGTPTDAFLIGGFRVKKNVSGDAYIFYVDTGDAATSTKKVFSIAEKDREKWERIKNEVPPLKMPAELKTALDALPGWDKTKYFDNAAQRAVLDTYLKPLFDSVHRPAKIGDYDIADDGHSFKFSKGGKDAFTITAQQVGLWKIISAVAEVRKPTLPASDALPAGILEKSIVGEPGWEDELGRRIGTKLLMGKLKMEQGQISKEKALDYVKGLGFWKRMGLYAALALGTAAVAIGASYLIGAGIAATIGWGAAFGAKWFALMGLKIAATAGIAFGTNHLLRKKWLDKRYGLIGTNGEPLVSFMERSKDASGYYRALKEFKKGKKDFDKKEGKLVRARNQVRSSDTPEFVAAKYQMGMDAVMANYEKGSQNERRRQFLVPLAIGGGIAGATAWYHWDLIKSLMPGTRPPAGQTLVPPPGGRGSVQPPGGRQPIPPQGGGPRFEQDRFGRWILPHSGQYVDVYCGAPRATCIPCDFTINGTRAHWYINAFTDSMRVQCPKGGMSHLLGNISSIPGGRATQEQVWALFERTLCADRDLFKTFHNVGNASRGKWIDFAVLKETTCIGGRRQMMIDVMIERAQNDNVRSVLRAMRESIIQNNPRLSVRLAR